MSEKGMEIEHFMYTTNEKPDIKLNLSQIHNTLPCTLHFHAIECNRHREKKHQQLLNDLYIACLRDVFYSEVMDSFYDSQIFWMGARISSDGFT